MDNDWHEYRENGYERLRPSTANKRVPALIEGYVLISQFSVWIAHDRGGGAAQLLTEADRTDLEQQQPPSPDPEPSSGSASAEEATLSEADKQLEEMLREMREKHERRMADIRASVPAFMLRALQPPPAEADSGDEGEEKREMERQPGPAEVWDGEVTLLDIFHIRAGLLRDPCLPKATKRRLPVIAQTLRCLQLTPDAHRRLVISALSSLAAIHAADWVHGDTNGHNIMVVWDAVARRLCSQWIDFEMARRRAETLQPLPSLPQTVHDIEPAPVPAPHSDPAAVRKVAATMEAVIDRSTTRRTASPSPPPALYGPFSAAADAYAVCSLGSAVLMGPHMDHPSGSGSNGHIYGEEGAFFAERNDITPLYTRHFAKKVVRETAAMKKAIDGTVQPSAAVQEFSPNGPAERHQWLRRDEECR
ncbi:unnamed protein product [Vitrella brassicaformis CCMP3155]|uniref:Protein kinase domain-containing protein n=1 Tax=Vitrella brassicaformis (strain CCMP3155) TaxID=1169540 RepID=A0A0G4FNY4_VITBC|nr:unnamed protein product [Vitrella brassicaformis CCMP3155]|eukprot:CEM15941.1 unnamed protein product [Vitrella brassicaformis CCMP3155]